MCDPRRWSRSRTTRSNEARITRADSHFASRASYAFETTKGHRTSTHTSGSRTSTRNSSNGRAGARTISDPRGGRRNDCPMGGVSYLHLEVYPASLLEVANGLLHVPRGEDLRSAAALAEGGQIDAEEGQTRADRHPDRRHLGEQGPGQETRSDRFSNEAQAHDGRGDPPQRPVVQRVSADLRDDRQGREQEEFPGQVPHGREARAECEGVHKEDRRGARVDQERIIQQGDALTHPSAEEEVEPGHHAAAEGEDVRIEEAPCESVVGQGDRHDAGEAEDDSDGHPPVQALAEDIVREEADHQRMGRHEDDRRRDGLPLDLQRGNPQGEVGREDAADQHHDGRVAPRNPEERVLTAKGTAAQEDRRPDDERGDGEAVQGDRDGRRGAPRDEDRRERDGDDRKGDRRVRASPHRLGTGPPLSNSCAAASPIRSSGNRRKVFRPSEHTARSRESMQMSDIKKIAVIGAGTMGAGIAQACAAAGFQVTMRDIEQRFVDGGFRRIREPLQKRVERGKMAQAEVDAILSNIRGVVPLKEAVDGAQLVIEAVFEKMEIKKELYAELDRLCPSSVVFASNTSSLSITEMATATKRADRVVGMHFFNPAPVMKLVEVIRGSETSDETVRLIRDVCAKLGKEAVEVRESPGFVVNRLLVPMMNEAFNLLQEGVASAEDIDKAMKLGTNMPIGPFELADYTGLDIGLDVMEVLFRETGDPKFRPSTLLRTYVRAGRLGKKAGRGVYVYPRT